MSLNKQEIFNTISNELDSRISKMEGAINSIKGQLFDVLTLGDDRDKDRLEQIKGQLENKKKAVEEKNPGNDNYIKNLDFLIGDIKNRINVGKQQEYKKDPAKKELNLNRGSFDKKVLDSIITELVKDPSQTEDKLITKLIGNEKYKEALKNRIDERIKSEGDSLSEEDKNNLKSIKNKFDSNKQESGEAVNTAEKGTNRKEKSKRNAGISNKSGDNTEQGEKKRKKGTTINIGRTTKNDKIDALKDLLINEKDQTELQKNGKEYDEVQYRLEIIAMNKNNDAILKDILKKQKEKANALKNNDKETADQLDDELYNLRKEIKKICGQRDEIFYKYFGEKYDDNDVNKFKRIVSPFVKTKVKYEGQDVYGVMSPFRKHRKARRKLNYVIAGMNMAGSNSEKGIINIMCRCKWEEANPQEIYNWIRARHFLRTNPIRFGEIYKEQKQKFIEDFISELKGDKERLSESDKKTIDQIKKRLDWYEEDFNRRHTAPIK